MITNFGKFLAVTVFFVSVFFLGITFATWGTSFNWVQFTEEMEDYTFEETASPEGTDYKVTLRRTAGGNPFTTTSKIQPEAILSARKDQLQRLNAEETLLNQGSPQKPGIPQLQAEIDRWKAMNVNDMAAMERYITLLTQQLDQLNKDHTSLTNQARSTALKVSEVAQEGVQRREDVYRLQNQFEEIKTDHERAVAQREELQKQLYRLSGTISALERRNEQLTRQLDQPSNSVSAPTPPAQPAP